jgi:hypothetical protein
VRGEKSSYFPHGCPRHAATSRYVNAGHCRPNRTARAGMDRSGGWVAEVVVAVALAAAAPLRRPDQAHRATRVAAVSRAVASYATVAAATAAGCRVCGGRGGVCV